MYILQLLLYIRANYALFWCVADHSVVPLPRLIATGLWKSGDFYGAFFHRSLSIPHKLSFKNEDRPHLVFPMVDINKVV